MSKNAKEMFEELGFNFKEESDYIAYESTDCEVNFYLNFKEYEVCRGYDTRCINMQVHKAITKQLEELNWL